MSTAQECSGSSVSALIFTLNEEENLPICLDSLDWCDDKIVVDSYSTDATQKICEARNVPFIQHAFEGFGSQRNWALDVLTLKNDWVLILDADERVPPALATELEQFAQSASGNVGAYRVRRRLYLWGKWLRYSSLYPNWVVRFIHRDKVRYIDRGHGETQRIDGEIGEIRSYLIDENMKSLDAWFERQIQYARKDAEFELDCNGFSSGASDLFSRDPLRRREAIKRLAVALPLRGLFYFIYSYIFRFGFLDGRNGYIFCRMKAIYQDMIEANKHDLRKERRRPNR